MTARRVVWYMVLAAAVEAAVFQVAYRDLLWLNRPVTQLQAAPLEDVGENVDDILARSHLTRRHLERLATATARADLIAAHVRTLARLHQLAPDDVHVQLRLAEAYRLAGRYDDARRLFSSVLEESVP